MRRQVACARAGEWQLYSPFFTLHFNVRSLDLEDPYQTWQLG
jgi:hypothetical protein